MPDPHTIRVRVLRGFVLAPGQTTKEGDEIDVSRAFAQQLLTANQVERIPDAPPAAPPEPPPAAESDAGARDAEDLVDPPTSTRGKRARP
jgi:hypothetical protein